MGGMKVHKLARGFREHAEPSLTLGCKRLRPLAPMLPNTATTVSSFDLKTFIIRPESSPRDLKSSDEKRNSPQIITGGTRWNPTQEQIVILEMLYKGGIQTPNQQQIEQITAQLRKYGKIEGKNVFYWFQNHKARERQKQKRNSLGLTHCPRTPSAAASFTTISLESREREEEICPCKRKYMSWTFEFECLGKDVKSCKEEGERTLELFPLHPGGR